MDWFEAQPPVIQALLGGGVTWGVTAAGAAGVVLLRRINQRLLDVMLGFAAGVMLAASFWSLLAPAIELAGSLDIPSSLPAAAAAVGAVGAGLELNGAVTLTGAVALTLGIALQNFPEGVAVAMPIRAAGLSRLRAFMYGQLSAIVEPIAAVLGAAAVVAFRPILPYALAFAAGAMVYVVVEELIPEAQRNGNEDIVTLATIGGFMVMMILGVALGGLASRRAS